MAPGLIRLKALASKEPTTGHFSRAMRELARFETFTSTSDIPASVASVPAYLTWLLDAHHLTGQELERCVTRLGTCAALAGTPLPRQDLRVQRLLRGLHQEAAMSGRQPITPLYLGDMHSLLGAIRCDRQSQARDAAILLLAVRTGWPSSVLRKLRWRDVQLSTNGVTVTGPAPIPLEGVTLAKRPRLCVVRAILELRRLSPRVNEFLFQVRQGAPTDWTIDRVLVRLPAESRPTDAKLSQILESLNEDRVKQLRDSAAISLGFYACLTPREARGLRIRDVHASRQGLEITTRYRHQPIRVPRKRLVHVCPVVLCERWMERMHDEGRATPDQPVFSRLFRGAIGTTPLTTSPLSKVVRDAAERANAQGTFAYSSLRVGFIREAVKRGIDPQLIMVQAGLSSYSSLVRHAEREHLLGR